MSKRLPPPPSMMRTKQYPGAGYELGKGQFGLDVPFGSNLEIDEGTMSVVIPFADGARRDGVGDLLEVGGINCERHRMNPVVLFDHGKQTVLPVAISEDPQSHAYTVDIDTVNRVARGKAFFYSGKGLSGVGRDEDYRHAVFCEQLFHMIVKRFVRGGSIGYQVTKALNLQPDYDTGTPAGLHLLQVLMLEYSAVILPANGDTVRKAFPTVEEYDGWVESTRRILSVKHMCGQPLSGYLVKSLTPLLPIETKVSTGYQSKGLPGEDCPHCGASLERDPYSGKCNSCGKDWPVANKSMRNRRVKSTSADLERQADACAGGNPEAQGYVCKSDPRPAYKEGFDAARKGDGAAMPTQYRDNYEDRRAYEEGYRAGQQYAGNKSMRVRNGKAYQFTDQDRADMSRYANGWAENTTLFPNNFDFLQDVRRPSNPTRGEVRKEIEKLLNQRGLTLENSTGTTVSRSARGGGRTSNATGIRVRRKSAAQAQRVAGAIDAMTAKHPDSPDDAQEMAAVGMLVDQVHGKRLMPTQPPPVRTITTPQIDQWPDGFHVIWRFYNYGPFKTRAEAQQRLDQLNADLGGNKSIRPRGTKSAPDFQVGEQIVYRGNIGEMPAEYRGKQNGMDGYEATIIVRPINEPPFQTTVPIAQIHKKSLGKSLQMYRGWKIESVETRNVGYDIPARTPTSISKRGRGRDVNGFQTTSPYDGYEKFHDTLRAAKQYIDNYEGDEKNIRPRGTKAADSQMDGNKLNNTGSVDSARASYLARVRNAAAGGPENGGNAIQNSRAAKSLPTYDDVRKIVQRVAKEFNVVLDTQFGPNDFEALRTSDAHRQHWTRSAYKHKQPYRNARSGNTPPPDNPQDLVNASAKLYSELSQLFGGAKGLRANKSIRPRGVKGGTIYLPPGTELYEIWVNGVVVGTAAGRNPDDAINTMSQRRNLDPIGRPGANNVEAKPLRPGDPRLAQIQRAKAIATKSINVRYRNKLVKGYAEVKMKFHLANLDQGKQEAFLKDMADAGMGTPTQGSYQPGIPMQRKMRLATYNVDVDPSKALDGDGNDVVSGTITKACGIARKHGVRFLGNMGKAMSALAETSGGALVAPPANKSMRPRGKAWSDEARAAALEARRRNAAQHSQAADAASAQADSAHADTMKEGHGNEVAHWEASDKHDGAAIMHQRAAQAHEELGDTAKAQQHRQAAQRHAAAAEKHGSEYYKLSGMGGGKSRKRFNVKSLRSRPDHLGAAIKEMERQQNEIERMQMLLRGLCLPKDN